MSAPQPWMEAFAPATLTNVGPGFACIGLAFTGPGSSLQARLSARPGIHFHTTPGEKSNVHKRLTSHIHVAVTALLHRFAPDQGIEFQLKKGLPFASGLGATSASVCAALLASESILGLGLRPSQLADIACKTCPPAQVAAAFLGGLVLITHKDPLQLISLPVPEHLWLAIYTPNCSKSTSKNQLQWPHHVRLADATAQAARLGLLIHALHCQDLSLLGESMVDILVEPLWAALIPSYLEVKATCLEAGAFACGLSGSGPTTFTLCDSASRAQSLLEIMAEIYTLAKVPGQGWATQIGEGAKLLSTPMH